MRANQMGIKKPERPSQQDYNRAHLFLTRVKQSTILTVEEKQKLRYSALHGHLADAQKEMQRIVQREMSL